MSSVLSAAERDLTKATRRGLPHLQELGLLIVIGLLYVVLTLAGFKYAPEGTWNLFLSADNQFNGIGTSMSIYAIMAIGMTCVIVTGGIDISVGSIMAFSGLAGASVLQHMPEAAPWYVVLPVAFLVPMAVGGLWGLANGAMIVGLKLHPFVVTLGTMSIIRGLCVLWFPHTVPEQGRELPGAFSDLMRYDFHAGLRLLPVVIMLAVVGVGAVFLHALVAGRETYAVGGNAEAARYSGIRVWWVIMRVYVIMGVCCGIAAVVELGRFFTARTDSGSGYELMVIASAVVGGASLTGGRGTALGAMLGTLAIAVIQNGIGILRWKSENTMVIVGGAIIVAASIDQLTDYLVRRRGGQRV